MVKVLATWNKKVYSHRTHFIESVEYSPKPTFAESSDLDGERKSCANIQKHFLRKNVLD